MKRSLTCHCEHMFEADIPDSYDISKTGDIEESILNGSFLSIRCPKCGTLLKPEFPVRIIGFSAGCCGYADIQFIPELERDAYLLGKRSYSGGRIAIGMAELMEKVALHKVKLDDRAVEILKYLLLEKMEANDGVRIFFSQMEKEKIEFHIHGLRSDKIGISKIPWALYQKVEADIPKRLKEDPFREILEPPYVSVTKISMEVAS
ncbi:CpXC domain-containing protein [Sediminispirochaeta bajacaliforniensis]|uniref:CpXC domain-containing protein n=1 Tax=Sediminispirochaeta bajacaliforniensis TaxID=148 RepID=UPI0003818314|nr:CpXC domain-containing protein [Sediminispirochaeta bajacaliforniensis]